MSVRAYLVKKIDYTNPIFNLWHDKDILNLLDANGITETLDADGCGLMEIPNDILEEFLAGHPGHPRTQAIQQAIDNAKTQGDDYITVYCF